MKRLFLDLDKCRDCKECRANCSYYYHPDNKGINYLIEYLTFSLVCRQCEDAPCISSCYHNALYKLKDGEIKRSNFLCTSCKSCYIACPFGTIILDMLDYKTSFCDICINKERILCIETCPYGAVEFKDIEREDIEEGIFFVGENFAVKTHRWIKDDSLLYKGKRR